MRGEPDSGPGRRVVLSGAGGLIGSALVPALRASGWRVERLVRRPPGGPGEIEWRPRDARPELPALEGAGAVIHLAGEPIAGGRWTRGRKRLLEESRVDATRRLAEAILRLERPPPVFLCASAVGYYGARGDEPLDETAPPGAGFLAGLCRRWEAASGPLAGRGIRRVHLRLGPVLSARGGILARMLPLFRLGLGGPLGSGRQGVSWIGEADGTGAILHLLETGRVSGGVNLTAPHPVSQEEFARTLGRAIGRPARWRTPAVVLRAAFGEQAGELLLSGARVLPKALLDSGYRFLHPRLDAALEALGPRPGAA